MSAASLQALDEAFEQADRLRASWQLDAAEDAYRALPQDERLRPRVLTEIAITLTHQGRGAEALAAIAEAEMLAPHVSPCVTPLRSKRCKRPKSAMRTGRSRYERLFMP